MSYNGELNRLWSYHPSGCQIWMSVILTKNYAILYSTS